MVALTPFTQMYMVIDVTKVEETKIRFVANIERATLLGKIYQVEHPGRKCIAPPLEGRGFSALDKLVLQYLYWNTFGETPPEDYQELIIKAVEKAGKLEVNNSEPSSLRATLAGFEGVTSSSSEPKAPKPPKVKSAEGDTPKATSTCGLVWAIADRMFEANHKQFPERKAFLDECEKEGIHPATASTQFAKWKKSKGVAPT